jgi:endonuclease YncB( thermonuclease family)
MRRTTLISTLVALAAVIAACGAMAGRDEVVRGGAGASGGQSIRARVTKVTDGDTIHARRLAGGRDLKVRLLGIDAPEQSATRYGRASCGGREATAYLNALAPVGTTITLRTDPTQDTYDRYQRLLAYEVLADGTTVEERLVRAGWAKVYVYRRPFERVAAFRRAAGEAVRSRRGIYRLCGGVLQRPL